MIVTEVSRFLHAYEKYKQEQGDEVDDSESEDDEELSSENMDSQSNGATNERVVSHREL